MVCSNCGKNLIRGYAFCLECGSPVPPEVLEEGGMPGRTDNEGRPQTNETDADKSDSETERETADILSPDGEENSETLVFCPNCGMHMQSDPYRCNICGMKLGEKSKAPSAAVSTAGIPDGISESDIEQISGSMSGSGNIPIFAAEDNSTPDLFGSDISANDFAALSKQLASFSAAAVGVPVIDEPNGQDVRQRELSDSTERKVENFSMIDAPTDAPPISDNGVPVIGGYSMDESPSEQADIDPYKFLNNSMSDSVPADSKTEQKPLEQSRAKEPEKTAASEPAAAKASAFPENAKPVSGAAPSAPTVPELREEAPFIEESAPFISEFIPEQPAAPKTESEKASSAETPVISGSPKQTDTETLSADSIFSAPVPPPETGSARPEKASADERGQAHGNLFRCQYCGQAMYDTDKVCKNCGASYKSGFSQPRQKTKAPLIVGICAAIVIITAVVMYFVILRQNSNPVVLPNDASLSSAESVSPEASGNGAA